MSTPTDSINSFVNKVTSPEDNFVIPAIQRPFIWKEKQICSLFDSIMRNFPLGTLLIWRTKRELITRTLTPDFLKHKDNMKPHADKKSKNMILDGQQRLQSLLIGLRGSYEAKRLCINLLSDPDRDSYEKENYMKYIFKFHKKNKLPIGWEYVEDLSKNKEKSTTKIAKSLIKEAKWEVSAAQEELMVSNLDLFRSQFSNQNYLSCNTIDEINEPLLKIEDEDVVEIFCRTNSAGTKLNKSDLLFSLLSSKWGPAYKEIKKLEDSLLANTFEIDKDYMLKATLLCLGKGAAYQIKKFKSEGVLNEVQNKWNSIKKAIEDIFDFLKEYTPVKSSKALVSHNALLPIIAMRYNMKLNAWLHFDKNIIADYILITSLAGSFNGAKDSLIDKLSKSMIERFDHKTIMKIFTDDNRKVDINEEKIWSISYAKPEQVYFAMKLVLTGMSLQEISDTHIDHIISKNILGDKFNSAEINELANLTILDGAQNKSKGKKTLSDWLNNISDIERKKYCATHFIPDNKELWESNNFKKFIAERKKLILNKSPLGKLMKNNAPTSSDIEEDDED